jgi:hypothetical protein
LERNLPLATLRRGPFRAQIVPDRFYRNRLFHFVIQRQGSAAVLAWGQERSLEEARHAAERRLELLMESEPVTRRESA